jgi:hypothetical protein
MVNTSDTPTGVLRVSRCPLRAVLGHDVTSPHRQRTARAVLVHGHRVGGASDKNISHTAGGVNPFSGAVRESNCFPARRGDSQNLTLSVG